MMSPQPEKDFQNQKEIFREGKTPSIEQEKIISELKERLERLESRLEKEGPPQEREKAVKEEIHSYLKEIQQTPPFAAPQVTRDEAKEIKDFPASHQVGALISLVFGKGLNHAVSVANALNNPAILDEFHDLLVDRYYNILVERKIIRPT